MADTHIATLRHPLDGRISVLPNVSVTPLPRARKLSLRLPEASVEAASALLGMTLPVQPGRSSISGTRAALWLGPDEWMIVDDNPQEPFPELNVPGSAVDISHRNLSIELSGMLAEATLAAGCPLDLSLQAFPVGKCTRTALAKADIILWRTDEVTFRVDCWPSFSDYVFTFLSEAAQVARL